MGDPGFVRFPGSLDPRAEEFRPGNPFQMHLLQPQIYYPYPTPPPPPPPPYGAPPFCDGLVYPQFAASSAYVSPSPPLPPPCTTATRTLLLSSVPTDVSESEVRRELEVFGDVRAVQMERVAGGLVTVHFYDLRHAQAAVLDIRNQHMQQQSRLRKHFEALLARNSVFEPKSLVPPLPPPGPGLVAGHAVWAQFTIPVMSGVPDGLNQGTLVIFNLDSEVSTSTLKEIFEAFGPVKELRETPLKRHQRFVEFYDVRDAAKALAEMNGKEIIGKRVVIEFSRPGGHGRKFFKPAQNTTKHFSSAANCPARNSRRLPPPPFSVDSLPPRCYNSQTQSYTKKTSFYRGNPNVNGGNRSANGGDLVQSSMASLCVNANGAEDQCCSKVPLKKNTKKGQNSCSGAEQQQQQQQQASKSNRPLKGRQAKNFDPRFLINEDAIAESNCKDSRTTVMIKNIPNKYSQKLLLNMLDNHCIHCNEQIANADDQPLSSYDFVYLPIDFINKCNVGYGFVNMTSPQAAWRLYKAFHLQSWEVFNSKKICEVTYARLQGLEALKEHFKNSKFPCEAEEYLPVVFAPPRDGRQVTEPTPIVCRTTVYLQSPPALSSKNSEADDDEDNDEETGGGNGPWEREVNGCINEERCSSSISNGGRGFPNGGDDGSDAQEKVNSWGGSLE
ncbi:protein terminal ear1 [Diospyros lotus]|uniref:protein terminal ear1 n=1 Tax=Diospyros lotus TaxID=55363 RepID=UPI002254A44A|nr:protein terminal ear1 [Diospyros lotus]